MKAAILIAALAACDPMWGAKVTLRDPMSKSIDDATVAIACNDSAPSQWSMAVKTRHGGSGTVGSIGSQFPPGCDLYVAKPGFKTHHIAYRELCPHGPEDCKRFFEFDLVLEPSD